jgi:hypothetical protein
MLRAMREQTINATIAANGSVIPVAASAGLRLAATAEAGAIVVIDWKRTPGRPIVLGRRFSCPSASTEVSVLMKNSFLDENRNG